MESDGSNDRMTVQVCKNYPNCKFGQKCKFAHINVNNAIVPYTGPAAYTVGTSASFNGGVSTGVSGGLASVGKKGLKASKHKEHAAKKHKLDGAARHNRLKGLVAKTKKLCAKMAELDVKIRAFDAKYGGPFVMVKDVKGQEDPFADEKKLYDMQMQLLRTEVGAMFGKDTYKSFIPIQASFSTTGGNGSDVLNVDPSSSSEWSAWSLLFDEFRVVGGSYDFVNNLPGRAYSAATDLSTQAFGLAYDATDNTAVGSTEQLATFTHHRFYANPSPQTPGPNSSSGAVSTNPSGRLLTFEYKVPKGTVTGPGGAITANQADWQPVGVNTKIPYGYIKSFTTAGPSALTCRAVLGMHYIHTEFRLRGE